MILYEEFQAEVQEQLRAELGADAYIKMMQVPKNNGVILDGICISRNDIPVSPVIYLNGYYEQYQEGKMTILEVMQDILRIFEENPLPDNFEIIHLMDFEEIRNNLRFKIINRERNQHLLESIAFVPILDLAIVFYIVIKNSGDSQMTAIIQSQHLGVWGISLEELKTAAFTASQKEQPATISSMNEVMRAMAKNNLGDDYSEEIFDVLFEKAGDNKNLYVLSNQTGINGAGCMFYTDSLKSFADEMGADLIILPSSVHECLLLTDDGQVDCESLRQMVQHINDTEVSIEDILSNKIYRYKRDIDTIEVIEADI